MKNNKGFTLVELLAVIVLIAVLSVVAVSTYRGINESSKKKTLDAKIEQITTAAEKWARENSVTNKMTISVNTLVVEGYVTADSVGTDGLAVIKNPVSGENMICNVVELSFKDGIIQSKFNGSVYNCKLAVQSLVDSNINIRVVSSTHDDLTGTGSIAKWTNKDIEIIVNSTEYDNKATSISYDFEGSTKTKDKDGLSRYDGTDYVPEEQVKNYYNVYLIKPELLLNSKIIVTYDIPGEGTKSRAYTIRFDKEEATVELKSNNEWITTLSEVQITVDDGKGSGPAAVYIGRDTNLNNATRTPATPKANIKDLQIGKYYIWTEDNVGNISHTYKMILEVNNQDTFEPDCRVLFDGTPGDNGWYKKDPVTPIAENIEPAGISGVNLGVNTTQGTPTYSGFAAFNTISRGAGTTREEETPKTGTPYYCHAKTLAGTYRTGTRTLYLDRTAPIIEYAISDENIHTKTKTITFTLQDDLSGLRARTEIKYGWSTSETEEPSTWETIYIDAVEQTNYAVTASAVTGGNLTGTYYLWIDINGYQDYAGNYSYFSNYNLNNLIASFGPYKFDNTAPVCNGNNGKTNWTNGTYTILQYCRDDAGTPDQSGCTMPFFTKIYANTQNVKSSSLTIRDNAGNTTVCPHDVYLEHIKPSCELHEPGPDGRNGWYKSSSVTITGTFQDNGDTDLQSGVDVFGTAKLPNSVAGATAVTFSENGESLTAWCYVRDRAGNEGANSLTFKKDDATSAQAGGCTVSGGNTTWANLPSVPYQVKVNNPPISGCNPENGQTFGYNYNFSGDCTYTESFQVANNISYKTFGNHNTQMQFLSNSGVVITCPYQINVYSDRINPVCSYSKTLTHTTGGVSVNVTCEEGTGMAGEWVQSNCVSSGDDQGVHTGLTSNTTYTVKDNAGNTNSCTVPVATEDCNCSYCHHYEPVCHEGYTYGTWGSCTLDPSQALTDEDTECEECNAGTTMDHDLWRCRPKYYSDCAYTTDECAYGCDTCYY